MAKRNVIEKVAMAGLFGLLMLPAPLTIGITVGLVTGLAVAVVVYTLVGLFLYFFWQEPSQEIKEAIIGKLSLD